ncbi:hypothetical protein Acr_00g0042660 [Actinidia rufa]|uniref:CCHC-type domain-containing protein n=1 Tax=Actinidia rufa TaxID=165716 RepID=A0A7J0DIG6_9ERIC|nr:hypothetical protein Acr_00g0042660 [Actinidia rufa]
MSPRKSRGHRGAAEPEDRVDRIEMILEGLVQVVHDVHNNNNHDDAWQQPTVPMPEAGAMPHTTIKQFQQLRPLTFYGTPDPMAAESWLLGIERKPLELLWLWPRFLEVFNEECFPEMVRDQKVQEFLNLKQGNMIVVEYNAKFMELSRYAPHIVSTESRKARRGQSSKRRSSRSLSGNSSAQQRNVMSQGSSGSNELSMCPTCEKKHRGECRMGTRACYGCGQEGYQVRDCPVRNKIQGAETSASASVQVYNLCEIRVNDVPMYVDLIPLEMHGFDVILGMDWLSSYCALIDCELKQVMFHSFAHLGLIFEGVGIVPPPYLISSMKASHLIQKGSQAFLCSVVDMYISSPSLEDIHVV